MPSDTPSEETDAANEARSRRTVIRLLVGLGIGIPVLIELATFVGLLEQSFFGGEDGGGSGGTATRTPASDRVGPGDDLLPETPRRETLTTASFRAGSDQWVLTLVASIENTVTEPYRIQFGGVTTEDGRVVDGVSRLVTVDAEDTGQLTGTWQLSPGSRPVAVEVRAGDEQGELTTHEVQLAPIPVEGN